MKGFSRGVVGESVVYDGVNKKAGTSKFTVNEGVSFEYNRALEGRLGKFNCDTTKILISFPPPPPPGTLINDQSLIEGGVTG